MACQTFFVTGTDTGIGKTWATLAIMQALQSHGHVVAGMKPVASGTTLVDGIEQNEDAALIRAQSSGSWPYEIINPYALPDPVSPVKDRARELLKD